jgi:hypothetical protein
MNENHPQHPFRLLGSLISQRNAEREVEFFSGETHGDMDGRFKTAHNRLLAGGWHVWGHDMDNPSLCGDGPFGEDAECQIDVDCHSTYAHKDHKGLRVTVWHRFALEYNIFGLNDGPRAQDSHCVQCRLWVEKKDLPAITVEEIAGGG